MLEVLGRATSINVRKVLWTEHAALPAVRAYYERLSERPAFLAHGSVGVP